MKTNVEAHKNWLSCSANYENADREKTKQHADMWERSEAVTNLSIKQQILRRAKPDGTRLTLHHCSQRNFNPTKYGIKDNNRAIVPASIHGTMCTVKTRQTLICFGLVAQKQDRETMAKCLCYWITKADSWLFAFTRSHSALIAKWWNPHRYKGHCYKGLWLCVGEQEM